MKPLALLCLTAAIAAVGSAQEVIQLSAEKSAPEYPEKQYFSKIWNTEVVTNVTRPSLTVFRPATGTANGTGIVICPGGGFLALSINSEGNDVAKWLAQRGVTAFVLKYRLAKSGDDATEEFQTAWQDRAKFTQRVSGTIALAMSDGITAMKYVRQHAADYGISPDKVGIIGFSAGATVTAAVAIGYSAESRPAFVAPIYGAVGAMRDREVPKDAPPMFIAAASDDQLGLAPDSIALYNKWLESKKPVELHMYAQGGHGFGMHKRGLPTDHWIDRFGEWLALNGFLKP